jgi:hypothetical protein
VPPSSAGSISWALPRRPVMTTHRLSALRMTPRTRAVQVESRGAGVHPRRPDLSPPSAHPPETHASSSKYKTWSLED